MESGGALLKRATSNTSCGDSLSTNYDSFQPRTTTTSGSFIIQYRSHSRMQMNFVVHSLSGSVFTCPCVTNLTLHVLRQLTALQSQLEFQEQSMVDKSLVSRQEAKIRETETKLEFEKTQVKRLEVSGQDKCSVCVTLFLC